MTESIGVQFNGVRYWFYSWIETRKEAISITNRLRRAGYKAHYKKKGSAYIIATLPKAPKSFASAGIFIIRKRNK